MKALSIGREQGCDIVINDNTDVISRRHAILNISSSGKITIVDQSRNGTYVNGIRISPNVPVPVSRKDIISFAHVAKLDWNSVPHSGLSMRYVIIGLVVLLVGACVFFAYRYIPGFSGGGKEKTGTEQTQNNPETPVDSLDTKKDVDKQVVDSDSIKRGLLKEQEKVKKREKPKKQEQEEKKTETPQDSTKNNRPIG